MISMHIQTSGLYLTLSKRGVKAAGLAVVLLVCMAFSTLGWGQDESRAAAPSAPDPAQAQPDTKPQTCRACMRANLEFLASDALRGRGSGTSDELLAAIYIASELERIGVEPAGGGGDAGLNRFLQPITIRRRKVTGTPRLSFGRGKTLRTLTYGKDFHLFRLAQTSYAGTLHKEDISPEASGAFVFLPLGGEMTPQEIQKQRVKHRNASLLLAPMTAEVRRQAQLQKEMPSLPVEIEGVASVRSTIPAVIYLAPEAMAKIGKLPEGTAMRLEADITTTIEHSRNVIGKISGSDPRLAEEVILLSAHLDHLGIGPEINGDGIYNGADDDASGVTAVLEMARALARYPKPRRTVQFALFGSEEEGLLGASYYREHSTVPLEKVVANLEFEMLSRADAAVAEDEVWLTGWERSDLGPELARHGAHLVGDPHLREGFFQRSDNYALALRGVVAHTVSSFGVHSDYHQPSDDLSKVDWNHMFQAIESLVEPVRWLVNSEFRPQWLPGKRP